MEEIRNEQKAFDLLYAIDFLAVDVNPVGNRAGNGFILSSLGGRSTSDGCE